MSSLFKFNKAFYHFLDNTCVCSRMCMKTLLQHVKHYYWSVSTHNSLQTRKSTTCISRGLMSISCVVTASFQKAINVLLKLLPRNYNRLTSVNLVTYDLEYTVAFAVYKLKCAAFSLTDLASYLTQD